MTSNKQTTEDIKNFIKGEYDGDGPSARVAQWSFVNGTARSRIPERLQELETSFNNKCRSDDVYRETAAALATCSPVGLFNMLKSGNYKHVLRVTHDVLEMRDLYRMANSFMCYMSTALTGLAVSTDEKLDTVHELTTIIANSLKAKVGLMCDELREVAGEDRLEHVQNALLRIAESEAGLMRIMFKIQTSSSATAVKKEFLLSVVGVAAAVGTIEELRNVLTGIIAIHEDDNFRAFTREWLGDIAPFRLSGSLEPWSRNIRLLSFLIEESRVADIMEIKELLKHPFIASYIR